MSNWDDELVDPYEKALRRLEESGTLDREWYLAY